MYSTQSKFPYWTAKASDALKIDNSQKDICEPFAPAMDLLTKPSEASPVINCEEGHQASSDSRELTHNDDDYRGKNNDNKPKLLYSCNQCRHSFACKEVLNTHIKSVHQKRVRPFKCTSCDEAFTTKSLLSRHSKQCLSTLKQRESLSTTARRVFNLRGQTKEAQTMPKLLLMCEACGQKFPTSSSLTSHIKSNHENFKPYKCSDCQFSASNVASVCTHIKEVHKERPYKCTACDVTLSTIGSLTAHFKTNHKTMNPHQCSQCKFSSIYAGNFRTHIKDTHTMPKQKPFKCDACGKEFAHKNSFTVHIKRKHKAFEPYKCECQFSASDMATIVAHVWEVHRKRKPF